MKVILDGEYAEASIITPKLHKFIGTWRNSTPPASLSSSSGYLNSCLVCGLYSSIENCWRRGHHDLPQYVTITKSFTQDDLTKLNNEIHDLPK